jgi:hypothetical protein
MDLFNKELTISEAIHYNSILDNGTVDTDLLLLNSSLNTPHWQPGDGDPFDSFMNRNKPNPTHISQDLGKQVEIIKDTQKNVKRQYIRLPNAIIRKHQHKYRVNKTKKLDEEYNARGGGISDARGDIIITDADDEQS